MATRYVRSTGNDSTGDGLTPGTAWATIQKAVDECAALGGSNIVNIGPGLTGGAGRLVLDATNNAQVVTIFGESGATMDSISTGTTTTVATVDVGSGCNTGTFNFENVTFNHVHSTTSSVVRLNNASATAIVFTFTDCILNSSHTGVRHITAGVASYTFTGCTLEPALVSGSSNVIQVSAAGSTFVFDDCQVNPNKTTTGHAITASAAITALTVVNGTIIEGSTSGNGAISVAGNCVDCTILDSTIRGNANAVAVNVQPTGTANIQRNTFTDAAGVTGAIQWLTLSNGTTGLTFKDNTVTAHSSASVAATAHAVYIVPSSTGPIVCDDNEVTSGAGGIWIINPTTANGITGSMDRNHVIVTSAAAAATADGLKIGDSTETVSFTLGAFTQNDNEVVYTGTNGGIALRMGACVRTAGSEQARNLVLGQSAVSTGLPYGTYNIAQNLHCHHNKVFGRSPCTFVGAIGCTIELNNWVSPALNNKGVASINKHETGADPDSNVIRQNFFVALFDSAANYAFHVEGTPTDLQVDRNWYGIVGKASLVLQNITALTPATTLADAQARWNTLGGDSTGGDLESILGTYDVFEDPAAGDFTLKSAVVDTLRALEFQIGADELPPLPEDPGVAAPALIVSGAIERGVYRGIP